MNIHESPTFPAYFAIGQAVLVYSEDDQPCQTRITRRTWDKQSGCWLYGLEGYPGLDVPEPEITPLGEPATTEE